MTTHPSPFGGPPPVADRRSPERRSRRGEELDDVHPQLRRTVIAAAIAVAGGLAFLFFCFAALGAVNIGNAPAATIAAIALGLVWAGAFLYRVRNQAGFAQRSDRERRGF